MTIYNLLFYFFIYGILGWCVEVAYAAVKSGKFVNRGFLNGPICPIYGVGVVSVILCLSGIKENMILLYLTSVILVTVIEGITGLVLDRLFHHKWWDYSNQPLNIGGYVCLIFSLIWGVFCVFIMKVFQPIVEGMVRHIPVLIGVTILLACSIGMIADLYVTAAAILKLNKKLESMERIAAELHELSEKMGENIYENVKDGIEKEEELKARIEDVKEAGKELKEEQYEDVKAWYAEKQERMEQLRTAYEKMLKERGRVGERLLKAFPGMESRRHTNALRELKQAIQIHKK